MYDQTEFHQGTSALSGSGMTTGIAGFFGGRVFQGAQAAGPQGLWHFSSAVISTLGMADEL